MRKPFIPRFRISHVSWRDAALVYGLFLLLLIAVVWVTLHFAAGATGHDRDDERRGRQHVFQLCGPLRKDPRTPVA